MSPLEFGWFLPTSGDTTSFAKPNQVLASAEMFQRVTLAAERAGFEYMLVPVQTACWEAWIASAMMVARSSNIKMLIAGASDTEAAAEGIPFGKEERYDVMDEEVTILKSLWTAKGKIDFDGRYYQLKQAQILPPIRQPSYPKIYLGGGSQRAWEISAKHADVHLFWGDTPQRIEAQILEIRKMAEQCDRRSEIGFGMRLQMICRENEEDAWDAARSLVAGASDAHKAMVKNLFEVSVANQRMQELSKIEDGMLGPNLWSGITQVRPGAGVAVVGNPQQCAATLQQFIDVGCHSFCLSGYLHDTEAERFGRLVRPLLVN